MNINIKPNQWSSRSTIAQIEFLACFTTSSADNKWSPISGDIFSKLWTNIRVIFEATPQPQTQLTTAKAINSLLIRAGDCMSCVEVSWEMDSFYQLIEATLSNTQDPSLHQVLEVRTRHIMLRSLSRDSRLLIAHCQDPDFRLSSTVAAIHKTEYR
jgi:hypothetical protein